jgi:hypothetical protein
MATIRFLKKISNQKISARQTIYIKVEMKISLIIKSFIIFFLLITSLAAFAQEPTPEFLRAQEMIKKRQLLQQLDSGVVLMDKGEYETADKKFVYVLNNVRSVPSDLTFYFGKNSFYLGKYKQSIDWLTKYIQLKGTMGQFSGETATLLKSAETEFLKEQKEVQQQDTKKTEEVMSVHYDIDCGPSGKVACPVCKGNHVIVRKGPFNDEYKTCPYCDEHGILTCEEYNKLLKGELKSKL